MLLVGAKMPECYDLNWPMDVQYYDLNVMRDALNVMRDALRALAMMS